MSDPDGGRKASVSFSGPLSGVGHGMARLFGIKHDAAGGKKGANLRNPVEGMKPKGISLNILLWTGARLPFTAYVLILGSFTYMYHIAPALPWFLVFLSLDFALIVCWPPKTIGNKHRGFWDWGPMYSWFLALTMAICTGLVNYAIIEQWVNITFLREYKDVAATDHVQTVIDAGVIRFTADTKLDTNASVGYKYWFYNYCAAPVVPTNSDPKAQPIGFWAVGIGCCDGRGGFKCDSGADETAKSGMPVRPHNLGAEVVGHYDKAIMMSAAVNGLNVAEEKLFVLWHKAPKEAGKIAWWISTTMFFVLSMFALCACMGCQSGFMHISMMQQA